MSASSSESQQTDLPRTGFFRRLGAWVYDALIIIAILLLATLIALLGLNAFIALGLITLAADTDPSEFLRNHFLFQSYLVFCLYSFYAWFWRRGGQTAGMKTWRLKIQSLNGQRLTHMQCIIRLCTCLLGAGNILIFWPGCKKRSLQDICSGTEMVTLSKEQNKHVNWKGYM